MKILLCVLLILTLFFIGDYHIYHSVFCYPLKQHPGEYDIPDSQLYHPYREKMKNCIDDMQSIPFMELHVTSKDGKKLYGKLYRFHADAPLIIFFHGYHGRAEWDGYGIFRICKTHGINLLMVDQRAHGNSAGNAITFGIRERFDCKAWADYAAKNLAENADIFLAGVSMGASSVMMASELKLPGNVRGIISDCGYTSPKAIICRMIRQMHLPVAPAYFLTRLGACIFGHINLEAASALDAVKKSQLPILFIHRKKDSVVPIAMNDELYQNCSGKKDRLLVDHADHANCSMTDYDAYEAAVLRFIERSSYAISIL